MNENKFHKKRILELVDPNGEGIVSIKATEKQKQILDQKSQEMYAHLRGGVMAALGSAHPVQAFAVFTDCMSDTAEVIYKHFDKKHREPLHIQLKILGEFLEELSKQYK